MTIKDRIAMIRSAINNGYLENEQGPPPLTLTKTLAKLPQSIAVNGASGGVGDMTANLCEPTSALPITRNGITLNYDLAEDVFTAIGTKTATSVARAFALITGVNPNTTYTYHLMAVDGSDMPDLYVYDSTNSRSLHSASTDAIVQFTTLSNTETVALGFGGNLKTVMNYKFRIMVVEGSYTATTIPDYEPYGRYKIPIIITDGSATKTINLYSDRQLTASVIRLFVYPKTKEAKVLNQDISSLQNWTQDWKIPKADELIVSAGTTVQPSSVQLSYWSKSKN